MIDRATILGSALVVGGFASALPLVVDVPNDPGAIVEQVTFPKPDPIAMLEVDQLGNILLPVQADAVVTHDGGADGPMIAGHDIRGSRCAQSVFSAMARTDSEFTVICLPREYGLYERMHGRAAPTSEPED